MARYTFHVDAGHGWIAVPRHELDRLGLLGKISAYSYQRGGTVYLEEDRDATLFVEALGYKPEFREVYHHNSPVRGYEHYRTENGE